MLRGGKVVVFMQKAGKSDLFMNLSFFISPVMI